MGLRIFRINTKYNILYIQGPTIPGPNHCYVRINDSCLPKNRENISTESHPPFPTFYPEDVKERLPEDLFFDEIHKFSDPTIKFEDFEFKQIVKRDGAKLAKIKGKEGSKEKAKEQAKWNMNLKNLLASFNTF